MGFSFMLLLILVLSMVSLVATGYLERHLRIIVDEHNAKADLMLTMRNTAKNRSMSLLRMFLASNLLERNNEMQEFNRNLNNFTYAQKTLMSLPLSSEEREVLSVEQNISKIAVETQSQVAALIMQDQMVAASELMHDEAMPKYQEAINKLEELIQVQRSASNADKEVARLAFSQATTLILMLGGSAIVVGALVALLVIRRSLHAEASLFRAKERAQVTLASIAEGVITTDAQGRVEYMNAVAELLTQRSRADSEGELLLDIFRVKSEEDGSFLPSDFINRVIESKQVVENKFPVLLQDASGDYQM